MISDCKRSYRPSLLTKNLALAVVHVVLPSLPRGWGSGRQGRYPTWPVETRVLADLDYR